MYGQPSKYPDRAYNGLIWKAKGTYRGENIHNNWFLVTKVYSGGDKVDVVRHPDAKKMTLPFTNKTVKWLIGDMTNDFVNIGEKRHKNEIKHFIKRHVGSGYSISDEKGNVIQPTGELITKRGDPRVSYLVGNKPKLEKTYDHDTISAFIKRVSYIADDINVEPKGISFKDMKGKKWGEATSTKNIRFDPELLGKDKDFQDKVIIHELLHLRYPNHSAMHKQMEKTYIKRYKDMEKPSSPKHVSKISDNLSIQELIDITRKNETELARLGMKLTPEQRTFDPSYQHIKKEIAEARVKISEKQFARLDTKKQSVKPKPHYIVDGTGQILHKSTSKEGAEKWFNKFKPTDTTYPEKRWKVVTKEQYKRMSIKPKQETYKPTDLNTLENIDQAKKHLKTLLNTDEIDEYENLRKAINKAEGVPETSVERTKAIRTLLKTEFEKRYDKKAKFSVKKGTGTVGSWTFITGSKDKYGHFTKEETDFLEDVLKGESIQGTNDLGLDYERAENHLRRITREKLKKKLTPETKPKKVDRSKSVAAGKDLYQEKYSPSKTHLAKTKTLTDMQKRRLIKSCLDNGVDTRELDPSLKYDENQEI
ncbi:MAG: M48 metallopeptidase family protein, partial [Candidatus Heimdallarchaeaceae archaeon]